MDEVHNTHDQRESKCRGFTWSFVILALLNDPLKCYMPFVFVEMCHNVMDLAYDCRERLNALPRVQNDNTFKIGISEICNKIFLSVVDERSYFFLFLFHIDKISQITKICSDEGNCILAKISMIFKNYMEKNIILCNSRYYVRKCIANRIMRAVKSNWRREISFTKVIGINYAIRARMW